MNKCKLCGSEMVELFSSSGCPNNCDKMFVDNVDAKTRKEIFADTSDKENSPEEKRVVSHSRSGGSIPTEEEVQEQKKKMLKALANFNTVACKLINGMTNVTDTINDVIISTEKFSKEMAALHVPDELYRQEYQCHFKCDLMEPIPMSSIMEEAINTEVKRSIQEAEKQIMATLGIPPHLISKNNKEESIDSKDVSENEMDT